MTAAVETAPTRQPATGKVTQARVIKSEWIKFRTLRSSYWSLAFAAGVMIAIGMLFAWGMTNGNGRHRDFSPIADPLRGMFLAQLAVGVLGCMVITGEYTTGMIRASLSAVPNRLPVLWAKALVFGAVVLVLMTVTSVITFLVAQPILATKHLDTTLSAPGALRIVLGTGLYLTVVGLLGIMFGTIIRSTAGSIAALFGVLLVLPVLGEILTLVSWGQSVPKYLPSNAGQALLSPVQDSGSLAPWTGFALFVGYLVLATAGAAYTLKRRDA